MSLGVRYARFESELMVGRPEQTFDVSDLSSGTYFVRLEAEGEIRTRKLAVIR